MIPTKTYSFSSGLSFTSGMKNLHAAGLRPEELLFLAFDPRGDVKLQVSSFPGHAVKLKVGHKLALRQPFDEGMYFLDAVHPLDEEVVVINGDRRMGQLYSLVDVAIWMSWFVASSGRESVFFGSAPHMPGSWWIHRGEERVVPLHTRGYVDLVLAGDHGLLARRSFEPHLYFLPMEMALNGLLHRWERVYSSPLGNLLLLERRIVDQRLLLNCQGGLVELAMDNPADVRETGVMEGRCRCAVVGRVSAGTFAVSRGDPVEWGFDNLMPATLVGVKDCSFQQLCAALRRLAEEE